MNFILFLCSVLMILKNVKKMCYRLICIILTQKKHTSDYDLSPSHMETPSSSHKTKMLLKTIHVQFSRRKLNIFEVTIIYSKKEFILYFIAFFLYIFLLTKKKYLLQFQSIKSICAVYPLNEKIYCHLFLLH